MSISLNTYVHYLAAVIVCGLGLWKGDRPLRLVSGVTIISWSITPLFSQWDQQGLNVPQTVTDVITAGAYVWLSLRWRRLWIVVMAALAMLVVLCPFVYLLDPRVHRNSWIAANNILAVFHLLTILVGFWLSHRVPERANEGALRS